MSKWIAYLPGIAASFLVFLVAGILGGPIAVAIAAMAVLPTVLFACAVTFIVLVKYSPANKYQSAALGLGLYVGSAVIILLCLSAFGPSQIM